MRVEPATRLTSRQQGLVEDHLARTVHGTAAQVTDRLGRLVERTGAAELIVFSSTHDREALERSDLALADIRLPGPRRDGEEPPSGSDGGPSWARGAQ